MGENIHKRLLVLGETHGDAMRCFVSVYEGLVVDARSNGPLDRKVLLTGMSDWPDSLNTDTKRKTYMFANPLVGGMNDPHAPSDGGVGAVSADDDAERPDDEQPPSGAGGSPDDRATEITFEIGLTAEAIAKSPRWDMPSPTGIVSWLRGLRDWSLQKQLEQLFPPGPEAGGQQKDGENAAGKSFVCHTTIASYADMEGIAVSEDGASSLAIILSLPIHRHRDDVSRLDPADAVSNVIAHLAKHGMVARAGAQIVIAAEGALLLASAQPSFSSLPDMHQILEQTLQTSSVDYVPKFWADQVSYCESAAYKKKVHDIWLDDNAWFSRRVTEVESLSGELTVIPCDMFGTDLHLREIALVPVERTASSAPYLAQTLFGSDADWIAEEAKPEMRSATYGVAARWRPYESGRVLMRAIFGRAGEEIYSGRRVHASA